MILSNIIPVLKNAKRIAILPHVSADGDALGSSFALGLALKKLEKSVAIYLEEDIPFIYSFLPGQELVCQLSEELPDFDVVVALDCGDSERLGKRGQIFKAAKSTVNIDHHATNTQFAQHNFVETLSAAVGEIIYQMVKMMDLDLDPKMATCLYVAIAADTGGFRYSNTTAITHQIAGDLVNKGVQVAEISQQLFETTSIEKVRLMGEAIKVLELFEEGKLAVIVLKEEMFKKVGAKDEDADGIANLARNIRGVEVGAVLKQRSDGQVKVNLRSQNYVDVSTIANSHGGGGHKRAAGFAEAGELQAIKQKLMEEIGAELRKHIPKID